MAQDNPPSYFSPASSNPVPVYSETPNCTEHVVQNGHDVSPTSSSSSTVREFVYKSEHLEVSLRPNAWGVPLPTYGLDATISGVVKFRKACNYVVEMTLTLRGAVNTSASQHATVAIPGINKMQLMQKKMTLFSASPCRSALAQGEFPFNIQFPVAMQDGSGSLPPSYSTYQPGISADVTYSLQVDIVRKGLRRHEMVNVPLLYLPKSRPYMPPLRNIPLLHPGSSRNERVKIIDLSASWPARSDTCSASQADLPLISLALPSPACFASGDTIPLSICILCPYSPALAELLTYNIGLFLIRRKKTWVSAGRQVAVSEQMVSRAAVFLVDGSQEGTVHLRLELRAGEHGRECSWQVDKTVAVEHAIRVVVRPPEHIKNFPSFRHEEPITLTTDQYGTLQHELLAMGGIPTPALGINDVYRHLR